MLSVEDNHRLTRVGPGTPMGALLRRYWHPIAAERELIDEAIKPVRLLGEDLVLYRDRSGTLGLVGRRCAHRSADLAYGFVDAHGIRCSYHGWCFDEQGHCRAQPFEEARHSGSTARERVTIPAYPVAAKAGLVWAYLGPGPAPCLMDWARFHEPGVQELSFLELECNWLQCQENSIDPIHFEWLHQNLPEARFGTGARAPRHVEVAFEEFEHGFIYRRVLENTDKAHPLWQTGRVSLLPNGFFTGSFVWHVPVDDEHTLDVVWNVLRRGTHDRVDGPPPYRRLTLEGDTHGRYSVVGAKSQDAIAMLGQGRVANRTLERLGESDRGIVLLRRRLLEEMDAVAAGRDPKGVLRDEARNHRLPLPYAPLTDEQRFGANHRPRESRGLRQRARGLVASVTTGLRTAAGGGRSWVTDVRKGAARRIRSSPESPAPDVLGMIRGYRLTALLYVVAKLKVADALAAGPRTADELAREVGADPAALARVLRTLVAHGVFVASGDRFALDAASERLRAGVAGSLHADALLAGEEYLPAWGGLLHSVRTGQVAFDEVFGTSVWEHRRTHRELNEAFNAFAARSADSMAAKLAASCDLGSAAHVVDVGGGVGALLAGLLRAAPQMRGTLVDQPHVAAEAPTVLARAGVGGRCDIAPGDFFVAVPEGADLYVLKHVLHDWDDTRAALILGACRRAMTRPDARLLVIESLLPDAGVGTPHVHLMDVHMLAVDGGHERSRAAYAALLQAAGLSLVRVTPLSGASSVLEVRRG